MKKRLFVVLAAVFVLVGMSANAQVKNDDPKRVDGETSIRGDVNEDGIVDVADINAIIEIMKNGGGTGGKTIYYWYIGQTDPSTMSSISPIVANTDMSSPGWREIGPTLPTYSSSNMLWNGTENNITFSERNYYYLALPNSSIQLYDDTGYNVMEAYTSLGTQMIGNVTYYVYTCNAKAKAFGYNIY